MTEKDKNDIAEIVIQAMTAREKQEQEQCAGHACPLGFDAATVETMRSFAEAIHSGKKAAMKAFITLAVGALLTALYTGLKEFFNK